MSICYLSINIISRLNIEYERIIILIIISMTIYKSQIQFVTNMKYIYAYAYILNHYYNLPKLILIL